jgi:hypothetical protein
VKKKPTAHSQNILHVDVLYNIKRKKTGSTEKQFLGPNRKVVADRARTNVRK